MQKSPSIQIKFISAFISFLIISIIEALVWYLVTQQVLMKMNSISEQKRQGYDNPFIDLLAMSAMCLLVGIILYGIVTALFSKVPSPLVLKMIIGTVTGLLPIIFLGLITFGIPFSDPAVLLELFVMAIAGGFFPFVQEKVFCFIQRNRV